MEDIYDNYDNEKIIVFSVLGGIVLILLMIAFIDEKPDKPQFKAEQVTVSEVFVNRNTYYNGSNLKLVDKTKTYIHLEANYNGIYLEDYVMIDSLEYVRCQMEQKIRSEYKKDQEIQSKIDSALQNNCN